MGKSRYLCQEIAFLCVSLVGLTLFPEASFGNSDQWLRVIELERNTIVKLECADGRVLSGRFIMADPTAVAVRGSDQDETIAREQVKRISIEKHGRRWYSIPLAGAVAVGGIAVGLTLGDKLSCSSDTGTCSKAKGILAFVVPAAAAILAYRATLGTSWKMIYRAPK
jgi:hypothetical protein